MQSIHRALKLHHHKHTGKLLPHRHTSYRVLFILLLMPMLMLVLVNKLDAAASDDLVVNAVVPAPIPSGSPVITDPPNNTTVHVSQITVSGTCPIITPAVVIAMYNNGTFAGSGSCASDGTFSVGISLNRGTNSLVATVVTITGGVGQSSQPVVVTYEAPVTVPSPQPSTSPTPPSSGSTTTPQPLSGGLTTQPYVVIAANGAAQWQGSFADGTPPYRVVIDWGDGTSDTYIVSDHSQQTFFHKYALIEDYTVAIHAVDATGRSIGMQIAGVAYVKQQSLMGVLTADYQESGPSPIIAFIERYIWQAYIVASFSVLFLWYIEHGRHLIGFSKLKHKQ